MSEKKKGGAPFLNDMAGDPGQQVTKEAKKETEDVNAWRAALSDEILAQSSSGAKNMLSTWLNGLKYDSLQFLEDYGGGNLEKLHQQALSKQAVEVTVDRLFSCLQGFAHEFNKVAAGTDLHVSGTLYGDVKEVLKYNKFREAEETESYFRARLSTRIFSLIIRGSAGRIHCFLMPVSQAMALSKIEREYSPLATIAVKVNEEGIFWRSVDSENTFDCLEDLCAWLFQALIERTKSDMIGVDTGTGYNS